MKLRQRHALRLIAETPGIAILVLTARGVDRDTLSILVDAGFVTETVERAKGGGREIELSRAKITEAGKQALLDPNGSAIG